MLRFSINLTMIFTKLRDSIRAGSVPAEALLLKYGVAISLSLALMLSVAGSTYAQNSPRGSVQPSSITGVKSWAFQLQDANPDEIAQSHYDLVVVDHDDGQGASGVFRSEDLEKMQ